MQSKTAESVSRFAEGEDEGVQELMVKRGGKGGLSKSHESLWG